MLTRSGNGADKGLGRSSPVLKKIENKCPNILFFPTFFVYLLYNIKTYQ